MLSLTILTGKPTYDKLINTSPEVVLTNSNKSLSTLNTYYYGYRALIKANFQGESRERMFSQLEKFKPAQRERIIHRDTIPSRVQLEKIRENLKDNWKVIFDCLKMSGLRVSELLSITHEGLEKTNEDYYTFKIIGKGKKERRIILPCELVERVKLFWSAQGKFFSITRQSVYKQLKKKTGINPHLLRHAFATHLIDNGESLPAVSSYLGHSSVAVTSIYCHNELSFDSIKRIA